MSFLKRLFGGGRKESSGQPVAQVEHEGYVIATTPIAENGQYRLAATIFREIDGEMREYRLIRADIFNSADDASDAAIRKAKLVIAEQGEAMFRV